MAGIYCTNCANLVTRTDSAGEKVYRCVAENNIQIVANWLRNDVAYRLPPSAKNAGNDCEDFEANWSFGAGVFPVTMG